MAAPKITTGQVKMIRSLVHARLRWSNEQYHQWLFDIGGPDSTLDLTRAQAANCIDILSDLVAGRRPRVWRVDGATVIQRAEIARLAGRGRVRSVPGVINRVTRGMRNDVSQLSIAEARNVIDALKSINRR